MKRFLPVLLLLLVACKQKDYNADLLVKNAVVYTVDDKFSTADAFVVTAGKIVAVGRADSLQEKYNAHQVVDAGGKAVYPGFIDAHAHFYEYGLGLQEAALEATKSWQDVVDSVQSFAAKNPEGWIVGRGWDQNKWKVKEFPNKAKLDSLFPARPVILSRIDGHAIMVNQAALNLAGVKPGQTIIGGKIETINGKLTGLMIDNAEGIITRKIPPPTEQVTQKALWKRSETALQLV
jgi:predicted amidohydrolase YtcJ